MNFYTSLIADSKITTIKRYGKNEAGEEGSVMHATFSLKGQEFMSIDSNIKHDFTFTPSFSIYITCDTEIEIVQLYEKLSKGGGVLMPLDHYPFSKMFALTWQIPLS